ncbi:hypothetical protein D3C86_2145850 [compost metagenome]
MLDSYKCGYLIFGGIAYNLVTVVGVTFNFFIFFCSKLARFVQDLRRNHALANIVKESGFTCFVSLLMGIIHPESNIV